jgi:2-dehydro-3-deoxyphosphogluconate aldolase/(4S)-4-hydroxy-2-oxoglutarate aldolase
MVRPISELLEGLAETRLLAILRGSDAAATVAAALALVEEGVTYLEVSLNTANALEVIGHLVRATEGRARIGAGTVITADDARRVRDAGGEFVVTPAVTDGVDAAVQAGLPVIAGALTPTECVSARARGALAVKLFPASAGGPGYLSALRDPFPTLPFIPVGGVDAEAAAEFLRRGAVAVGVGGPLLGDAVHAGGDLNGLRKRTRRFLSVTSLPGGASSEDR